MRVCPICHSQVSDESYYCTMCGNRLPDDPKTPPVQAPVFQNYCQPAPVSDPFDHTAEFEIEDVASNKL